MFEAITTRLQAWLLSAVVTRFIKAPTISLTTRYVGEPQIVDVPTRHGPVRCYITRPAVDAPLASGPNSPVHINIHGGAFLIGAPHQDDHLIKAIAGEVGAVVVNVDYSRAPKVRYPHAEEECFDVLSWVAASGRDQGWDGDRISISGTSAGGNLALATLELARRNKGPSVRAGVLFVPVVDLTLPPESYVSDIPKPFVGPSMIRLVEKTYFPDASRRSETLASPALGGKELSELPPLVIFSAEHDTIRAQIEAFVHKLQTVDADVSYVCVKGVDHDFEVNKKDVGVLPDVAREMIAHLTTHLADK
jgi:acetyl esterase/lipase